MTILWKKLFTTVSTGPIQKSIKTVTVIGGGKIGSGIVQIAAQNAHNVILVELDQGLLKRSAEQIIYSLTDVARDIYKDKDKNVKKYVENTMKYITGSTNPLKATQETDLVIEAIPEDFDKKTELFKRIDISAPTDTIFASTTDSLSIATFARKSSRSDRFVGLHFFHPVTNSKLVEVVKVPHTTKETLNSVTSWCNSLGKATITCNDSPGFVVNRLLITYITEAIRMMEKADASSQDIDTAMRLVTGHALGPIQLADYLGHDNIINLVETWRYKEPENMIFQPCPSQKRLVEQGKLGIKSGEGYYKYNDLKYWVRTFAHRYKNKKDWMKHYQIWRRQIEREKREKVEVSS